MANYSEFVNRLSALTGLNKDVLNAWASRENGVNNNILGVTSGGSLVKYPSQTAAAEATAKLIQTSPNYAGIRASEGKTSQQQALAIAQSPWRLGGTGIKLAGGTDPYYYAGFVDAGILAGNTSKPGGGVSTPTMPDTNTSGGTPDLGTVLAQLGLTDPTHTVTADESAKIAAALGHPNDSTLMQFFTDHQVGDLISKANSTLGIDTGGLPNLDIPGALMFVAVILVGITFLILGGIIVLRKK